MHTYILRRLLLMIPTLIGITIVVFVVMAASPGGISAQSLVEGQNLEPQAKKALEDYYNRLYGLDQPPPVQYLRWLNNVLPVGFSFDDDGSVIGFSLNKGSDLGTSFRYGRPVLDLIAERVPITLLLNVLTIPIIYLVAIGVGVRAATERGGRFDIASSVIMLGLWSVPTMLAGVLLIGFFASDQYWHWFPTAGLSRRAALDMPFLPHWTEPWDIVRTIGLAAVGAGVSAAVSRYANRGLRVVLFGALGLALGVAMARALPGDGALLAGMLAAPALALTLAAVARLDAARVRGLMLSGLGGMLGLGAAAVLMEGAFITGFLLDRLWHLALPVVCLSYGGFAFLSKLTRTAVLENLLADYARTARAKGVGERQVLWRHVFRNSLLPLITVMASLLPGLLAGSVIVESIFSIDGMGRLAVEAVQARDRELVLSITLISGLLTLLGYLLADVLYAMADPRVSYE